MNTFDLECILAYNEFLNQDRAAGFLGIGQSAFSRHISSFEKETGIEVFDRNTRPAALTPEVKAMLPLMREMVADAGRIMSANRKVPAAGEKISVGCSDMSSVVPMMRCLGEFRRRNDNIFFETRIEAEQTLLKDLSNGLIEFAFVPADSFGDDFTLLNYMVVEKYGALIPSGHPYASAKYLTREELGKLPCSVSSDEAFRRVTREWFGDKLFINNTASSLFEHLTALTNGMCCSLVPMNVAGLLNPEEFTVTGISPELTVTTVVIRRKNKLETPAHDRFEHYLNTGIR